MFLVEEKPRSVAAESYKTLRTNIQYSSLDKKISTLVITSSEPGEGKSMTSTNLAVTFAQDNKKVLLIDCDLRKPSVHKLFKISNLKGLSEVLIGSETLEDSLYLYNDKLTVLPSGHIPPNPSEMLSSKAMESLLNTLREDYDVIVLDSPPLQAVTDAQILSAKADGTILVLKANVTKKESIIQAKELLEKVGANILGVVLNMVKNKHGKYYYYYGEGNKRKRKKR